MEVYHVIAAYCKGGSTHDRVEEFSAAVLAWVNKAGDAEIEGAWLYDQNWKLIAWRGIRIRAGGDGTPEWEGGTPERGDV